MSLDWETYEALWGAEERLINKRWSCVGEKGGYGWKSGGETRELWMCCRSQRGLWAAGHIHCNINVFYWRRKKVHTHGRTCGNHSFQWDWVISSFPETHPQYIVKRRRSEHPMTSSHSGNSFQHTHLPSTLEHVQICIFQACAKLHVRALWNRFYFIIFQFFFSSFPFLIVELNINKQNHKTLTV